MYTEGLNRQIQFAIESTIGSAKLDLDKAMEIALRYESTVLKKSNDTTSVSVNIIKSQDGMRARTLGKIQCYSCKKFGHKSNECRSKKNKVSKDRADGHEKADRKSADKKLIKCYNCNEN